MKSVLKPEGIIRTNLHSFYERSNLFRAQSLFKRIGLMDGNPGELEIKLAKDTMKALRNEVLPTLVPITLDSIRAACLLPLWDGSQSVISLVERWQQIQPVDPVTLEPIHRQMAFDQVKKILKTLDSFLYVILERSEKN